MDFPLFLHYSEGNSENESDDDKEKIGFRIPVHERQKKILTLIMGYGKRKIPYVRSDSLLLWVPQQIHRKIA